MQLICSNQLLLVPLCNHTVQQTLVNGIIRLLLSYLCCLKVMVLRGKHFSVSFYEIRVGEG